VFVPGRSLKWTLINGGLSWYLLKYKLIAQGFPLFSEN